MEGRDPKGEEREKAIQKRIVKMLRYREWLVIQTHGNASQQGFPDLFAAHRKYGSRWVEVKKREGYVFTAAQELYFPKIKRIWVLVDDTEDEYDKLHRVPNWFTYLKIGHKNRVFGTSKVDGNRDRVEKEVVEELREAGWFVLRTHGNLFQKGLPDLYCVHEIHGHRWVEIKDPKGFVWTGAQLTYFPLLYINRCPIWVLRGREETGKLLEASNLREYMDF